MAQLQATGITGSLTVLGSITGSLQSQEYELITRTSVSAASNVNFTLDEAKYSRYKLIIDSAQVSSGTQAAAVQLSANSGSTFQALEYVLYRAGQDSRNTTPSTGSGGTSAFISNTAIGTLSRLSGEVVILLQPNNLIQATTIARSSTSILTEWQSFHRLTADTISNYLRFTFSGGATTSGSFSLLGMRKI